MTARETCKTCWYWGAGDGTATHIVDDPPNRRTFAPCRIRSVAEWPQRDITDWCGEHEPGPSIGKRYIKNDGEPGEAWDAVGVYGGDVYFDPECLIPHPNPIFADANGVWPVIYVRPA